MLSPPHLVHDGGLAALLALLVMTVCPYFVVLAIAFILPTLMSWGMRLTIPVPTSVTAIFPNIGLICQANRRSSVWISGCRVVGRFLIVFVPNQ